MTSSYQDIMAMMAKSRESAVERIKKNKHILFDAFDANGINSAEVTFDGSGDSGSVEDITLEAIAEHIDTEKVLSKIVEGVQVYEGTQYSPEGMKELFSDKPATVNDLIESICYDALKAKHEGWENNGGAYGELRFNSEDRTIFLEFNERSIECHEHEF